MPVTRLNSDHSCQKWKKSKRKEDNSKNEEDPKNWKRPQNKDSYKNDKKPKNKDYPNNEDALKKTLKNEDNLNQY